MMKDKLRSYYLWMHVDIFLFFCSDTLWYYNEPTKSTNTLQRLGTRWRPNHLYSAYSAFLNIDVTWFQL